VSPARWWHGMKRRDLLLLALVALIAIAAAAGGVLSGYGARGAG